MMAAKHAETHHFKMRMTKTKTKTMLMMVLMMTTMMIVVYEQIQKITVFNI